MSQLVHHLRQAALHIDKAIALAEGKVSEPPYRPPGWSPTTTAPYYKERYARELRKILDKIEDTREEQLFRDPRVEFRVDTRTLRQRFNQAWQFLCDEMDENGKYRKMREQIEICTLYPRGIGLRWKTTSERQNN